MSEPPAVPSELVRCGCEPVHACRYLPSGGHPAARHRAPPPTLKQSVPPGRLHNRDNLAMLAAIMSARSVSLFYSYAHEDRSLREQLEKHLKLLQRQGLLSSYHDRGVAAHGDRSADESDDYLEGADLILLLISKDFLASDGCFNVEMERALARHHAGEAQVVPILLSPVDNWENAPFGCLQCLPRNGRPVTMWPDQDEAWVEVAGAIRLLVEQLWLKPLPPGRLAPRALGRQRIEPRKARRLRAVAVAFLGLGLVALLSAGIWWGNNARRPSSTVRRNELPAEAAVAEPPSHPHGLPTPAVPPPPTLRPENAASAQRPRPARPPALTANPEWEVAIKEGLRLRAIPEPRKAIEEFAKALRLAPPKNHPQVLLELAKTYKSIDSPDAYDAARGLYQQVAEDPKAAAADRGKAQQEVEKLKSMSRADK